jgi:hypothetical protein
MADFVLKGGREIDFDLSKITLKEWQGLRNPTFSSKSDNDVIANITGLTVKEIEAFPFDEFRRLFTALVIKSQKPLSDPN